MTDDNWRSNIPGGTLSHYFDPHFDRQVVKIKPGEYFATRQPMIIATTLGSCVSACIRDNARGSAGMNHFMLPGGDADGFEGSLRYGVFAMESLINEFVKHGSARCDLEAKVFGGAAVVKAISADVGGQNARFVVNFLATEGIRTSATDLGGTQPRKIYFFVEDGHVLVKYIRHLNNDTIERREVAYAHEITDRFKPKPVELF